MTATRMTASIARQAVATRVATAADPGRGTVGWTPGALRRGPLAWLLPVIALQSLVMLAEPPIGTSLSWLQALVALALMAGGGWAMRSAARELDWNATPACVDEAPRALVVTGPYARSRHPMYAGALAVLVGVAVALDSPLAGAVALAYAGWVHLGSIRDEERRLAAAFGPAWRAYSARVRRWL